MYIDLDNGAVHFGSDGEYYGTAFTDVKVTAGTCLYPMVTASCEGAVISIVYRGQGTCNSTSNSTLTTDGVNLNLKVVLSSTIVSHYNLKSSLYTPSTPTPIGLISMLLKILHLFHILASFLFYLHFGFTCSIFNDDRFPLIDLSFRQSGLVCHIG